MHSLTNLCSATLKIPHRTHPAGQDTEALAKRECYKSKRDYSCLRSCRKGLSFLCSTIHPLHLLVIRNNHNCHYNRVFSQHQCHSTWLQMYCFSCSTYPWHFTTLPPHFCFKRVQTIPLTSFLKRNCCKPLYKPLLVYSATKAQKCSGKNADVPKIKFQRL